MVRPGGHGATEHSYWEVGYGSGRWTMGEKLSNFGYNLKVEQHLDWMWV
jgi:hypothetical protein